MGTNPEPIVADARGREGDARGTRLAPCLPPRTPIVRRSSAEKPRHNVRVSLPALQLPGLRARLPKLLALPLDRCQPLAHKLLNDGNAVLSCRAAAVRTATERAICIRTRAFPKDRNLQPGRLSNRHIDGARRGCRAMVRTKEARLHRCMQAAVTDWRIRLPRSSSAPLSMDRFLTAHRSAPNPSTRRISSRRPSSSAPLALDQDTFGELHSTGENRSADAMVAFMQQACVALTHTGANVTNPPVHRMRERCKVCSSMCVRPPRVSALARDRGMRIPRGSRCPQAVSCGQRVLPRCRSLTMMK